MSLTTDIALLNLTLQKLFPEDATILPQAPWKSVTYKRKELITAAGDTENYLYFICDGVQRVYYLDEQQRESTIVFTYSPSFGGVLDSFLLRKPASYYYETLTPSRMLRLSVEDFVAWQSEPKVKNWVDQSLAITIAGLLERIVELQICTSEEKFKKLLQRSPHILQLVPHKYLASYLGIDPTNFSKLINNVKV